MPSVPVIVCGSVARVARPVMGEVVSQATECARAVAEAYGLQNASAVAGVHEVVYVAHGREFNVFA